MEVDRIYNIDCLEGLKQIKNDTIDLTVTSPPYDNLRKYNGYCFDFENVAKEIYRVTKEGGVVVWVVGDATVGGTESCTSFKQALFFKEIGFNLNDTMIWRKTNPMPQFRQPCYAACFEYMFVFSKGKPKTFNPIMRKTKCGGQNYDSTCKNADGESGRTEKHFIVNSEAVEYNIWDIAVAQNKTIHPAVFPVELAQKHILSWTNEGDLVLDTFIGSGTTAIASVRENRRFIGFELNKEYYDIACKRIKQEKLESL